MPRPSRASSHHGGLSGGQQSRLSSSPCRGGQRRSGCSACQGATRPAAALSPAGMGGAAAVVVVVVASSSGPVLRSLLRTTRVASQRPEQAGARTPGGGQTRVRRQRI